MRSTFKVLFYLKRNAPKKSGLIPVMCRITVNGKIAQFSCKLDVEEKSWNVKSGRVSGRSIVAQEANRMLDKIRVGIDRAYQQISDRDNYVTAEKVRIVQDADYIYREELANAGLEKLPDQYFAALTNMRSVGVMGDERTYDYAIALRAVETIDFMTATASNIPFDVLQKVMSRIINEVKGVNRCFYDITSKPPGTVEFE